MDRHGTQCPFPAPAAAAGMCGNQPPAKLWGPRNATVRHVSAAPHRLAASGGRPVTGGTPAAPEERRNKVADIPRPVNSFRREAAQGALHCTGAGGRLVHHVAGVLQLLLHLLDHPAEAAEPALDRAEHVPHLAGALLDGQRAEAHLQRVQQRGQRGRAGQGDAALALPRVDQRGASSPIPDPGDRCSSSIRAERSACPGACRRDVQSWRRGSSLRAE
jgi:hypothetical protein